MYTRIIGITKEVSKIRVGIEGISFSFIDNFLKVYENNNLVYLQKARVGDLYELSIDEGELISVNVADIPSDYYTLIAWMLRLNKNNIINNLDDYINIVNEAIMSYDYYRNLTDQNEIKEMNDILYDNSGVRYSETNVLEVVSKYSNIRLLVRKAKSKNLCVVLSAWINAPSREELYDFMKHESPISYLPYGIYKYILSEDNNFYNEPQNNNYY